MPDPAGGSGDRSERQGPGPARADHRRPSAVLRGAVDDAARGARRASGSRPPPRSPRALARLAGEAGARRDPARPEAAGRRRARRADPAEEGGGRGAGHRGLLAGRGPDDRLGRAGRRLRLHPQAQPAQRLRRRRSTGSGPAASTRPRATCRRASRRGALDERDAVERLAQLTQQQARILQLVCEGKLNKQIAYDLDIAETTVKAHLTAILRKLNVQSRTQAVLIAQNARFAAILQKESGLS